MDFCQYLMIIWLYNNTMFYDFQEDAGELTPTETEFVQSSEIKGNLQKSEILLTEFESKPATEALLETKTTEIPDVAKTSLSSTDIPEDNIRSQISEAEQSLALQSDMQVDKSELSVIVCKAPEKTDEKTVEHEKITPAEKTPVESTTDLQISERQASEIQRLPDDEVDKAVVKDIELEQSVSDQKASYFICFIIETYTLKLKFSIVTCFCFNLQLVSQFGQFA